MARILYVGTSGTDDPTRAGFPFNFALGAVEAGHQPEIFIAGEAAYLVKETVAVSVQPVGMPPLQARPCHGGAGGAHAATHVRALARLAGARAGRLRSHACLLYRRALPARTRRRVLLATGAERIPVLGGRADRALPPVRRRRARPRGDVPRVRGGAQAR